MRHLVTVIFRTMQSWQIHITRDGIVSINWDLSAGVNTKDPEFYDKLKALISEKEDALRSAK